MVTKPDIPRIDDLKAQAKRLRIQLDTPQTPVPHARALELVAGQYGYSDWNTLCAVSKRCADDRARTLSQRPLQVGDEVAGTYLGQQFVGRVIGIRSMGSGHTRLTLHFDEPVDVVTFDSFSAFRQRVSCTLDEDLVAPTKLSDGTPHMRIEQRL
ncbi:MAG: glyoxalase superfamily protein [Candidatus Phaeomarinobacter sp.]